MGTIAEKLAKMKTTKADLKAALIEKGQAVSDTDTFASYADKIRAIKGASWVTVATTLPNPMYRLGDVNMDGSLTQDDAIEIMNFNAGDVDLTPIQKVLADVDFDREIESLDAIVVIDIIAGTRVPMFDWATAVEYAGAKAGDDVKAVFEIDTDEYGTITAPAYAYVPWDGIIAIYSNISIPGGSTGLIQILK